MNKSRKWLQQKAIKRRERQVAVKSSLLPGRVSDLQAFNCQSKLTSQATRKYKKIPLWELKPGDMKKSRKWLQQEAIQRREWQAAVKRSLLPGTVSDLRAFNCQSKLTSLATRKYKKNPTLRTQAPRYEEITKVVAARSHQAMIATGSSKKVIAPS
jgi:polysaccharide pyruvyl transferase WcaK-like protein